MESEAFDDVIVIEERPWGSWKVVHREAAGCTGQSEKTVKVLTVNPGAMLSLQSHKEREEFWVPLDNGLVAYFDRRHTYADHDGTATLLPRCKAFKVARNERHRLINPTDHQISLVEIILGDYDEEDIKRYHDAYGRN